MFNQELFNKICNVSCTLDELKSFVINIDKKEFDLDNPFTKYYNLEKIICAIEKYQSKEIDADFLGYWMNAYDWIIMGGFQTVNEKISLKKFLIWEIADWLDSLSFFDDSDDWYNLEDYKNTFRVLDYVFQDIDNCKAVFAEHYDDDDDSVDYGILLITNDNSKYFIKIFVDSGYDFTQLDLEKVEFTDLENRAKKLSSLGYRELKYCTFSYED